MRRVQSTEATYFAKLEEHWSSLVAAGKTDPDGKSSLQFVRGAVQYMNKTMEARSRMPDSAVPGARRHQLAMREAEVEALNELKPVQCLLESCEHHFHSLRRQHHCREEMEDKLPNPTVLLQLDYLVELPQFALGT